MAVTHTLIPNQLLSQDNISPMTIILEELSDGDSSTGMIVDPTNGALVCAMSDLATQPIEGSIFKVNVKSQVGTKSTIDIRVSYNGGSDYIQIANYIIAGDNDSSFEFATYNASSEVGNTDQLNATQVNAMQFSILNELGIIHDLNVTIDNATGGRIRIQEGRVFVREGRIRI